MEIYVKSTVPPKDLVLDIQWFQDFEYMIGIGPQVRVAGGDVTDWMFALKPDLQVTFATYNKR